MPTIKLIPSTHAVSSTSYLSVSNEENMYDEANSTDYATITNTYASTSSRYLYLRGFNFDDIPANAIISDFEIRIRGYQSGLATSTSYSPRLANGTSVLSNTTASSNFTTSATTITIPTGSLTWDQITDYGSNFTIMVYVRRNSRNTTGYFYCYGAQIEVTYTIPNPRTVTTTLSGNGTIVPSGETVTYDGAEFELTITPTNISETITVVQDGNDVTNQLVAHGAGQTVSFVPNDYTTSGIQSGSSYASYCVGNSAEDPSTSGTSSNMYASSSSTGYAAYGFDFSSIPSNAVIENIEVRCYGHRESSTISSTYVSQCVLYSGNTAISEQVDFPSTSNSIITIIPTDMPTRTELDNVMVRHYVGYYGGLVLGITFEITYSTGTGIDHYTYTYTVNGDSNIAVKIGGGSGQTPKLYVKLNGSWVQVAEAYIKVNGTYQLQSDLTTLFKSGVDYYREE